VGGGVPSPGREGGRVGRGDRGVRGLGGGPGKHVRAGGLRADAVHLSPRTGIPGHLREGEVDGRLDVMDVMDGMDAARTKVRWAVVQRQ